MTTTHVLRGSEICELLEAGGLAYECDAAFAALRFEHISEYAELVRENGLYIHRRYRAAAPSVPQAQANGALAYVSDQRIPTTLPCLYTPSVFKAATAISRAFYDNSADRLEKVLVIGTKGKTTTSRMLHAILSAADPRPSAYCTTNRSFDGKVEEQFAGTVSDPSIFYPLCERALANGCWRMVAEMPSYAELCARLDGLSFAHGIFTNLDYDHVSPYGHRTYEGYVACKKRMFSRCQHVLANLDDPRCDEFIDAAHAQSSMTFSPSGDERADFSVHDIRPWRHGHAFTVTTPSWEEELRISMPGVFSVHNALAAIGQAWVWGIGPQAIREGIRDAHAEGRMMVYEHGDYLAFVDFAHNGLSFRAVLESLRADYPSRRIVVVSGVGGRISAYCHEGIADAIARYADRCIVTTDNPLDEDPALLCQGLHDRIVQGGGSARIVLDRAQAIRSAVEELRADEVLLVAGKGTDREQSYFDHDEPYEGDDVLTERYLGQK